MLSDSRFEFTKDNIDAYLKALAKEYRKQVGKRMPAEIIIIGGASVLINYGFRNMTTDIDALILAASAMKDAINSVGDQYDLPNGWLNSDFSNTDSYSEKLIEHSVFYKTYSNVLTIRTVSSEYLIAMKLRSGRLYKSDMSDVLGILAEHKKQGNPISMEQIQKAVSDLYGSREEVTETSKSFIESIMREGNYVELYEEILKNEEEARKVLIRFDQEHPGILGDSNADQIVGTIQNKANSDAIIEKLRKSKDANS